MECRDTQKRIRIKIPLSKHKITNLLFPPDINEKNHLVNPSCQVITCIV